MRKKIDITEPNTLNVGLYAGQDGCGLVATLRKESGVVELLAVAGGDGWALLAQALEVLHGTGKQVVIFTNHAEIADALQHPSRPPAPDKWVEIKGWGKVGYGGNVHHWACLRMLTQYGSAWKVFSVPANKLKRAGDVYAKRNSIDSAGAFAAIVAGRAAEGKTKGDGGVQPSLPSATRATKGWHHVVSLLGSADRPGLRHAGSDDGPGQAEAVFGSDRPA
jgi:hypothetical protein